VGKYLRGAAEGRKHRTNKGKGRSFIKARGGGGAVQGGLGSKEKKGGEVHLVGGGEKKTER